MKIWKGFGSAHSADLTIISKFKDIADAQFAAQIAEDFANASWEERYPDVKSFIAAWKARLPSIEVLGPNQSDFELGLEHSCDITRRENIVTISAISSCEIGGIIKLMLLKDPDEVKVVGRTGP
jgi:hypothetical protein